MGRPPGGPDGDGDNWQIFHVEQPECFLIRATLARVRGQAGLTRVETVNDASDQPVAARRVEVRETSSPAHDSAHPPSAACRPVVTKPWRRPVSICRLARPSTRPALRSGVGLTVDACTSYSMTRRGGSGPLTRSLVAEADDSTRIDGPARLDDPDGTARVPASSSRCVVPRHIHLGTLRCRRCVNDAGVRIARNATVRDERMSDDRVRIGLARRVAGERLAHLPGRARPRGG